MAERRPADNYPTPAALALRGWEIVQRYLAGAGLERVRVCEPGCGDAQPFLAAAATDARVRSLWGCDLRPVRPQPIAVRPGVPFAVEAPLDWTQPCADRWDVIITNPPYVVAEAFVRVALERLEPNGVCMMLTRIGFLASQGRRPFWSAHPPTEVAVIRPRPGFTGDGGTDSTEYAYMVWAPGQHQGSALSWCDWPKPPKVRLPRAHRDDDL